MNVEKAVKILKSGGVMIFPTDTVWGIGVFAGSSRGVKRFYEIKKRDRDKPTAVLVADMDQAEELGLFGKNVRQLTDRHWPGALTVVVKEKGGKGTIGLRVPADKLVGEICRKLGAGIMAGSANFAGKRTPRKKEDLDKGLLKKVDMVVEGEARGGDPSTVVDTTSEPWKVLRQGMIKLES